MTKAASVAFVSMDMISIVCPTISGREHWLERAKESLRRTVSGYQLIVYTDLPTCGEAWNLGIEAALGDYVVLFADDLEAHPGWWQAGVNALENGYLPCPRILNSDGTLQSCGDFAAEADDGTLCGIARVPFLTRKLAQQIVPIFENHYMGDYWISWRCRELGWPTRVVRNMLLTHHMAKEGRRESLDLDIEAYMRATS